MKTSIAILMSSTLACLNAAHVYAGGTEVHGGDLLCDAQIQTIVSNIQEWLEGQGPEVGKLDLSSSRIPTTKLAYALSQYDSAMLALLAKPLSIDCVRKDDPGYPVVVDGVAKVCENSVDSTGVHMTCDRESFVAMTADQQIEQIHHEFATDVPGLEPDNGPISSYKISLQLSAFTQDVTEKKLVVMAPQPVSKTYTTSKGAVFTQVQYGKFGLAWKDPSGTIWSKNIGNFTNLPIAPDQGLTIMDSFAIEACAGIDGKLPTALEYGRLVEEYFDTDSDGALTDRGRKDLYAIFPDMLDLKHQALWFWTSIAEPGSAVSTDYRYNEFAYCFNGHDGIFDGFDPGLDPTIPVVDDPSDQDLRQNREAVRCLNH